MKKHHFLGALAGAALLGALGGPALAAPSLRKQVTQKGDFVLLGTAYGQDCSPKATTAASPVVGTVGPCPASSNANGPDVFWEADFPAAGQATASTAVTAATARSTVELILPAGATVTSAYLYWSARPSLGMGADSSVVLDRPSGVPFSASVTALQTWVVAAGNLNPPFGTAYPRYQSVADVTALVQQNGVGAYRLSGMDVLPIGSINGTNDSVGWWMVVIYQDPTAPTRQVTLFDGLDYVTAGLSVPLSGFVVPAAGYTAHLGVVAYDGDNTTTGDGLTWDGIPVSDALNPADNIFNATRSYLGTAVSNPGDLPQLSGLPGSMSELDFDVIDVTAQVSGGQTTATIAIAPSADIISLGGFITSITTLAPDLSTSSKTVTDVTSGGGAAHAGDVLQYTITTTNTGNDPGINAVITDTLPAGVTYVPGSLRILTGFGAGAMTDALGDDQGEYNAGTNTVTFRVGQNANGAMGGTLAIGASSTVTFQVKINAGATGTIANQGTATAAGMSGAPVTAFPTDGNGPIAGSPPTTITISSCPIAVCACLVDADCGGTSSGSVCDNGSGGSFACIPGCRGVGGNGCVAGLACTSTTNAIGSCVTCNTDAQCGNAVSGLVCNAATHACQPGCRGMNGNGCPAVDVCTSTTSVIGACVACLVDSSCGGVQSGQICNSATDTCQPGCRGMNGNGCPTGESCTSMTSLIGTCVACLLDADCGGVTSGTVCNTATHACQPGCRGMMLGNGCPGGDVCTSPNATIGTCVQCLLDADCGGLTSGQVCNAATQTCQAGCRGMNGNGCAGSQVCSSMDSTIGTCSQCGADPDCGGAMSGLVCDATTKQCVSGCRGMNGNGCPTGDTCTSIDSTIGTCVKCTTDADCGGATSGLVCDATTKTCGPGCRGKGGNGCPTAEVCTSADSTIGMCVQCTADAQCGDVLSGEVCNAATSMCEPGCRGMSGNGCPTGMNCTSTDTTIGMCVQCAADAQCGDAMSGLVCDATTGTCGPGCRGMGGNGCPAGDVCTSQDTTVGTCVQCAKDSDCGGPVSGAICDATTGTCGPGCRGTGGNACPSGQVCSSTDSTPGTCGSGTGGSGGSSSSSGTGGQTDGITASGNGLICAAQPGRGDDDAGAWLLGGIAAVALASRRRRRR